jgi:hypothetical protein
MQQAFLYLHMRWSLIIILFFSFSCKSLSEAEKLHQTLTGKWLIVAPDHKLKDAWQRTIYSRIQDSIVELKGLKLVHLFDNGTFQLIDSTEKKGRWGITADNVVFIEKGGKGFDNFSANYTGFKSGVLELTEFVEAEGEKIELTWNLKKITSGPGAELFDEENNEWRKTPNQPETKKQITARLSVMLQYYADYYKLVTKEATFFIPSRIILPFRFYQHAMGMKPFDEKSFFVKLFFNKEQAEQAWQYLKRMMSKIKNFPSNKTYVAEYIEFMEQMADGIKDLD